MRHLRRCEDPLGRYLIGGNRMLVTRRVSSPRETGFVYAPYVPLQRMSIPLVRRIFPELLAKEIVAVQPLTPKPRKLKARWTVEKAQNLYALHGFEEGLLMQNIVIKKAKLLNILKENRGKHEAIFEEALAGYRTKALELLEDRIKRLRKGEMIKMIFQMQEPQNQCRDYDRIIRMLELSEGATVTLNEQDFAQYVQDDWNWKRSFLVSNSLYSATARQISAQMNLEE